MDKQYLQKDADAKLFITITDMDGVPVDPSECDLWFQFYTSRTRRVEIERKRGCPFPPGMSIADGKVVLHLNRPGFVSGRLYVRFRTRIYDAAYVDDHYDFSSGEVTTDILVVK